MSRKQKSQISLTMPATALRYSPASPSPSASWRSAQSSAQASLPTEIVPRLFISDICAAESAHTLVSLGITHVLSAMCGRVILPPALPLERLQIPLQDSPFSELANFLPSSTSFVSNALRDPNARVLVHCAQGVSRSSSVVCAYLIAKYGWSPEQALQYVKSKYSQADPNPGFVMQLGEYARSLQGAGQ
ncbi:uncharacterized protein FIBRA_02540 [Fibroporia radiculosa]|uniref:protein-tyrosine-phosphatase n=1 Tax=Fibroporia radiculosa TaxID=599839 RepID=J4I942_9APHY|nr:uncharacterized protein FIBRA_02540 [Fibroporia radiculosa]CCM00506.1 predicted protein [Fibroporia radiculosa]